MEGTQEGAKQTRGNKGDGSIQAMARGKWRVAVDFGVNPVTRKRERVTRVVNGSKADARKVRDRIKQEHENGLSFEAATVTFGVCKLVAGKPCGNGRTVNPHTQRRRIHGGLLFPVHRSREACRY